MHSYLVSLIALLPQVQAWVRDDDVGRLPAMGWNSWNAYHCEIDDTKFLSAAQKLVDSGLKDAGYTYVNIDDCWQDKNSRDSDGHLVPNATRFPDGISGLAAKVNSMGLKLGIYNTAGQRYVPTE